MVADVSTLQHSLYLELPLSQKSLPLSFLLFSQSWHLAEWVRSVMAEREIGTL